MSSVALVKGKGLLRRAGPVLERVGTLVQQRRAVVTQIAAWADRSRQLRCFDTARFAEYQSAVARILPADFLDSLTAIELRERGRYLQALALRIERAEHDPKKDALKAQRLKGPEGRLAEAEKLLRHARPSSPCRKILQEYAALVEEFRISVFAPELGTRGPVSEKRLREKWTEVENLCQRVE